MSSSRRRCPKRVRNWVKFMERGWVVEVLELEEEGDLRRESRREAEGC